MEPIDYPLRSQEELDLQAKQKEEELQVQQAEILKQREAAKEKDSGSFWPKPIDEPSHSGELRRAVVGGVVDMYNSIGSLPKFFDKDFYKPTNPDDPYKYEAPWLIDYQPIMKTQWGKPLQHLTEFAAGMAAVGGVVGWGIKGLTRVAPAAKGLTYLTKAGKTSRLGRVGLDAIHGAAYDAISNQSQEGNLAAAVLEMRPGWSKHLSPFATTEYMSPAQKMMYNVGEGAAVGTLISSFLEAGGWALRSRSVNSIKQSKQLSLFPDEGMDAVEKSIQIDNIKKAIDLEKGTKAQFLAENPNKSWKGLSKADKDELITTYANNNAIDYGPIRDQSFTTRQNGKAHLELAEAQLEFDLSNGSPRENPAYYKGGDVTDNPAISTSSTNPVEGIRDQYVIRNDINQADGSPKGVVTEANIRRLNVSNPGSTHGEVLAIANALGESPSYLAFETKATREDLLEIATNLQKFISDTGHSRLVDVEPDALGKWVKNSFSGELSKLKETPISENYKALTLNHMQVRAADVVMGQLLSEARDIARAGTTLIEHVDLKAPGSLLDNIFERYKVIGTWRKEASATSSWDLRQFGGVEEYKEAMGKAVTNVRKDWDQFKNLIKNDANDELLAEFIHYTAVGGGADGQKFKDLEAFFKKKLWGGPFGTKDTPAFVEELATMGINSMLSGMRTQARALIGTGMQTVFTPSSMFIGGLLTGNDKVWRGALANLEGMRSAMGESWQVAKANWDAYNANPEGWRGMRMSKSDLEWEATKNYYENTGSLGDKAAVHFTDVLRNINKSKITNYGPRALTSIDAGFTQIIGRGRQRQLAFNEVYDSVDQFKVLTDRDLPDLINKAEKNLESKVWSADGTLQDELAKFHSSEAKLTQELDIWGKNLEGFFEQFPYIRPWFVFMRTGVNALKMTAKYTPLLNRVLTEHSDIMTKLWDDPVMVKYGIKSQEDLEIAQSIAKGRAAMGYGFVSLASGAYLAGNLTGNGPPDRELRETWTQVADWQPRSIKMGDKWVSYEALEPFAGILALLADIGDAQKVMGDEYTSDWLSRVSWLVAQNVTNKSFLTGLNDLSEMFTGSSHRAKMRNAANLVNNQLLWAGLRNDLGKTLSPGMRELNAGFLQSIGNRNLWAAAISNGELLPYKMDLLDGSRIRNWDWSTRMVNTMLPFNINTAPTPARQWLMRSGIDLKETFMTAPKNGMSLKHYPDLRSRFQSYIHEYSPNGLVNLEQELELLFNNPLIIQSIVDMENDKKAGRQYNVRSTFHGQQIRKLFSGAKQYAWEKTRRDNSTHDKIRRLEKLKDLETFEARQRSIGDNKKANEINKQIKKFKESYKLK